MCTALVVLFVLEKSQRPEALPGLPLLRRLRRLDPIGTVLLSASLACLLLALQFLSTSVPATDARVWGCLLGIGILAASFVGLQIHSDERQVLASLPAPLSRPLRPG